MKEQVHLMPTHLPLVITDMAADELADQAQHYGENGHRFLNEMEEAMQSIREVHENADGSKRYNYTLHAKCPNPQYRRCVTQGAFCFLIIFSLEKDGTEIHVQAVVNPKRATRLWGFGYP